jgi:hypothetical protein
VRYTGKRNCNHPSRPLTVITAAIPTTTAATPSATAGADAAPALPTRPDSLNTVASRTASNYASPYNRTSPYGGMASSPYGMGGGYGGYGGGAYGNRFGGMGGMYGSSYGMGGGYGMGGMYGQQNGMYGPQDQSLTQTFSQSTQTTFQMIESIVGAFFLRHGFRGRAVRQSAPDAGLCPRNLHNPPLDPNGRCASHRSPTTCGCHISHTSELRRFLKWWL